MQMHWSFGPQKRGPQDDKLGRVQDAISLERDFEVGIRPRPDQWNPCHPIFAVDGFARMLMLFARQNACRRGELCASNLPSDRGRRDLHFWIVADAFRLSHIAARHHVELAVVFSEPHWSRYAN